MDLAEAIQVLVLEDFVEECTNENHSGRQKTIFRFVPCDTVCSRCIHDEATTIRVVKFNTRNSVWLDDISKFVDCSHIRRQSSEDNNKMLIHLRENHMEDNICEADNFCSLGCKLDHVLNHSGTLSNIVKQHIVKKGPVEGNEDRSQSFMVFTGCSFSIESQGLEEGEEEHMLETLTSQEKA